jgi:hypothetical protein
MISAAWKWSLPLAAAALRVPPTLIAQTSGARGASQSAATPSDSSGDDDWLTRWMHRVDESRGLEIIPTKRLEIGISPPPYLTHQSNVPDGFGDTSFQVKYRVSSAPERKGDYFVGVSLAGSLPTGNAPNGTSHPIFLPTLAVAKGIGSVDVQATLAAGLPVSGADRLGLTIVSNTAVDLRIKGAVRPMIELNATYWSGGALAEQPEVFVTPGFVIGSLPLAERLHIGFGAGVQTAVSPFRRYNHRCIGSVRLPF